MVYDLLPLQHPEFFPTEISPIFKDWFENIATFSDGLICDSRTVANEVGEWLTHAKLKRAAKLPIGYLHSGADIEPKSIVSKDKLSSQAEMVLKQISQRPTFLMVGTLEPRKGHRQALAAVEQLWQENKEVNLVIVGKRGWKVDDLIKRLNSHTQKNKCLFWLQDTSDELLLKLYEQASALLAASEGEGFGLPLIEAAQHKLPIIARDIPVFREVAGEHAFYFQGITPASLANSLKNWLDLYAQGQVPSSEGVHWQTWSESAQQLLDVILKGKWYTSWLPAMGSLEKVSFGG